MFLANFGIKPACPNRPGGQIVKLSCATFEPMLVFRSAWSWAGLFARVGPIVLLLTPPLVAQSPTWRVPVDRAAHSATNDLQLTLRVRAALLQDNKLAPHQIGVSVRAQV